MFPELERFEKWLRRTSPCAATPIHYLNDLKLFFAWAGKPSNPITLHDVDAYIEYCRQNDRAVTTVNWRLADIHSVL